MNRKILGLLCALASVAGCDLATKTDWEGPVAACKSAGPTPAACVENSECCSYACLAGICAKGDTLGAVCATTNDCGTWYDPVTFVGGQMLCKSGHCDYPTPAINYCRDLGDVCTLDAQCCSGNRCTSGSCTLNRPPAISVGATTVDDWPVKKAFTFTNTTTDPDGDSMVATWTLRSKPALSALAFTPTSTWAPSFTPDVEGAYVFDLVVTDQPSPSMTSTATVTVNALNLAPVVTPALATTTWERNVGTLTIDASVFDENADSVDCAWSVCRPGTASCLTIAADPAPFTAPNAAPGQPLSLVFPSGLAGTQEGDWDVALACGDGSLSTTGITTVTVTNTPPAITVPASRTFNLGADVATTPTASITALAADANGDAIASWTWTVLSAPPTSAVTTATLGGSAATDTAIFKPDVLGDYTLTIRACDPEAVNPPYVDRPSPGMASCATATVVATVYPYVRPLGHAVTDAVFAKGASLARLVVVGPDATAGALWDYDLLAGAAPVKTSLAGAPNAVTLTPDGATAVAGDDVNVYKVVLGASPSVTTWTSTVSVGDVVAISGSDAFAFPRTAVGTTYYQRITLSNGTFSSAFRYGAWGAYVTGTADNWFVADTAGGYLYRMSLNGQNLVTDSSRSGYAGGKLWSSGNGAHVFAADGSIYPVPATPVATLTPLATTLGLTGIRSVDTSATESVVLAAPGSGSYVARYGSTFTPMISDALPHWGYQGADRGLSPLFAFVSHDGSQAFVVVRTTATPDEYGLYTYSLP